MNSLIRSDDWNPLSRDPFTSILGNWSDLVPSAFRSVPQNINNWVPAVDIKETDSGYEVIADLPGISKDDIDVTVVDKVLSIVVNSEKESVSEDDGRFLRKERYQGKVTRSFKLNRSVDDQNIQANYKDGVLSIIVPKKADTESRKIEISVH